MSNLKQLGTIATLVGSVLVGAVAGMIVGAIYAPVRTYEYLRGKNVDEKTPQDDEI